MATTPVLPGGLTAAQWLTALGAMSTAKVGFFSRDNTLADGTQTITGVGFTPKALVFMSATHATAYASWGLGSTGILGGVIQAESGSFYEVYGDASSGKVVTSSQGVPGNTAQLTTIGTDGFTVTWAKSGSPSGTTKVYYLAIG